MFICVCACACASLNCCDSQADSSRCGLRTGADELGDLFRELMHGRGKELEGAKQADLEDLSAFTGVAKYPARIKCALLGWAALKDALAQARA